MSTYCTFLLCNILEEQSHLQWLKAYQWVPEDGLGKLRGWGRRRAQRSFPMCWVSVVMVSCCLGLSKLLKNCPHCVQLITCHHTSTKLFLKGKHGLDKNVCNMSLIMDRIKRKCENVVLSESLEINKRKGNPAGEHPVECVSHHQSPKGQGRER